MTGLVSVDLNHEGRIWTFSVIDLLDLLGKEAMSVDMHDVKFVPFRFERGIKPHTSINVAGASLGVNRADLLAETKSNHRRFVRSVTTGVVSPPGDQSLGYTTTPHKWG